jgi:DNA-binding SARP family transcriptional activator
VIETPTLACRLGEGFFVVYQIALRMLGGFDLVSRGERIDLPPSAERVVAYVALHQGPTKRSNVAGSLWLDVTEERAMANLRSALWRLRRPGVEIIEATGDHLSISPFVAVDVRELDVAAREWLDGDVAPDLSQLDRLTTSSDLLNDWYDDWVLVEREHFRQLRLQALERLSLELAAIGQYGRAVETALAAVASEPLRESAHRALISVHLAQGNRGEAIRQYCIYRRLMRDELDLEPTHQMDALIGPVPRVAAERVMQLMTRP